ncbi:hypothetical protein J5N97_005705 [Dioscorea zingiberensis]|uniref:HMA domain-containing protein n=1 Tax=Dioscorea zingiberensis TaxID=325984 RepID=A0A9D5HSJ3_9LILI|nr:hypothetical protein J5N97_005705 [Dioscorea zingiberensis]
METLALPKIPVLSIAKLGIHGSSPPLRFARPSYSSSSSSTRFGPLVGRSSSLSLPAQRVPRSAALSGSSANSETGSATGDLILAVEGMMCDGCAGSVKRILESQPQVSNATVSYSQGTAFVWASSEVNKSGLNWQQEVGEKLAQHLTTCGFMSQVKKG